MFVEILLPFSGRSSKVLFHTLLHANSHLVGTLESLFDGLPEVNLALIMQGALDHQLPVLRWAKAVSVALLLEKINRKTTTREQAEVWSQRLVKVLGIDVSVHPLTGKSAPTTSRGTSPQRGLWNLHQEIQNGSRFTDKPQAKAFFNAVRPQLVNGSLRLTAVEEALEKIPNEWLMLFLRWTRKSANGAQNIQLFLDFCETFSKADFKAKHTDFSNTLAEGDDRRSYLDSLFSRPHDTAALTRLAQLPDSVGVYSSTKQQWLQRVASYDFKRQGPLKLVIPMGLEDYLWLGPEMQAGPVTPFSEAQPAWTIRRIAVTNYPQDDLRHVALQEALGSPPGDGYFQIESSSEREGGRIFLRIPGQENQGWISATTWKQQQQKTLRRWYPARNSDITKPEFKNKVWVPAGTKVHIQTEAGSPGLVFPLVDH